MVLVLVLLFMVGLPLAPPLPILHSNRRSNRFVSLW
jgi:hypothetical protein